MIHRRSVSLTLPPPLSGSKKKNTPRKTISQSPQWKLQTLNEAATKKSSLKSCSTKHVRSVSFPDQQEQQVQQCDDPALFSLIASPGRCSSAQHRICISPNVDPQLTQCYSYERPSYRTTKSNKSSKASRKSCRTRSRCSKSKRHYRHSSHSSSSKNDSEIHKTIMLALYYQKQEPINLWNRKISVLPSLKRMLSIII